MTSNMIEPVVFTVVIGTSTVDGQASRVISYQIIYSRFYKDENSNMVTMGYLPSQKDAAFGSSYQNSRVIKPLRTYKQKCMQVVWGKAYT